MGTRGSFGRQTLLPLVLVTSLAGCATPSSQPVQPPVVPKPPPELMQPPEPGLWSDSVRGLLQKWLKLLTPAEPA